MKSLDSAMKISTRAGASLQKKAADYISLEEEEILWSKGALGGDSPIQLVNTLFYLNGMHFALRGGEEQSQLSIKQFTIETYNGKKCLRFRDVVTKTFSGGLKSQRIIPKDVRHFENLECPDRCHLRLFEVYISKRPEGVERFYLKPSNQWKEKTKWYTSRPIGKNQLCGLIKKMCTDAGLSGNKRNHSLKATCATRLYQAGVDEQMIMERTGHRSTVGVRAYKRTSDVQMQNCSAVLDGTVFHEISKVARGSVPGNEAVKCSFIFKDCNVTIHNN